MSEDETQDRNGIENASSILPGFLARSFLAKFLVALLLVTVVIVGVSANTYAQTNDQLTADTETEYTQVATQSAIQIQEWRDARSDTTLRIAQFEAIRSGTQSERQNQLESERERLPEDVNRVLLVDTDGYEVVASTGARRDSSWDVFKIGSNLNSREAPWQTEEISYGESGVFVSSAEEALGFSLVSFVTPVETEGDQDLILVTQTNLDTLAGNLPALGRGVYSQVVDEQGRVVAGTQQSQALNRNDGTLETYTDSPESLSILQAGLNGQTGFVQGTEINATTAGPLGDTVVAFAPVEGEQWIVATHVPLSTAYELRNTITQNLLILSATAFLGIGLIGIIFGRGSVGALNRLTRKAEELEAGNLDVDLEVTRVDEFGRLTASFANMRDTLRARIEEAESARKEAEVSRSEALAISEYLQEKAEDYGEVMRQCGNGDLTQRMELDRENDAMDEIAEEFNAMLDELEKTTGQLKTFSEEVAESSDVVLTNTENVRASSEKVTTSVGQITDDATDQEAKLQELAGTIDEIVAALKGIQDNPDVDIDDELAQFQRVSDVLNEAIESSGAIRAEAAGASETAQQQADELDEVSERADRLKRYAKPLGGILDRFETAAEHEFVFSGGPSQPVDNDD